MTLCEAREKAPGMMRKLPNFVPQVSGRVFEGGTVGPSLLTLPVSPWPP